MTPVETSVGVQATSEDLAARPGEQADADFVVTNYGLSSYFTISGTDDEEFLTSLNTYRCVCVCVCDCVYLFMCICTYVCLCNDYNINIYYDNSNGNYYY